MNRWIKNVENGALGFHNTPESLRFKQEKSGAGCFNERGQFRVESRQIQLVWRWLRPSYHLLSTCPFSTFNRWWRFDISLQNGDHSSYRLSLRCQLICTHHNVSLFTLSLSLSLSLLGVFHAFFFSLSLFSCCFCFKTFRDTKKETSGFLFFYSSTRGETESKRELLWSMKH